MRHAVNLWTLSLLKQYLQIWLCCRNNCSWYRIFRQ